MRDETRKRLERALWMQKAKWVGAGLGVLAVAAAGLWFTGLDASVENRHVAGVVAKVGPLNGMNTQAVETGLAVDVKLDDGRVAHVMVLKTTDPQVGQHTEIIEHVHGTGRSTFSWK